MTNTPQAPVPEAQQLLSQMHGIVTPADVGIWPPAPGWWLALALFIAALVFTVATVWQKHRAALYRKQALGKLEKITTKSNTEFLQELSALLKRVALTAYPSQRSFIAGAYGKDWIEFLSTSCGTGVLNRSFSKALGIELYGPAVTCNLQEIKAQAAIWIKTHKKEKDLKISSKGGQ